MNCPARARELTKATADPITVDVCAGGCAGIRLDHFEHAKSEAELERARKIASALRFICPSTYLPGKQGGGAF